MHNVAAEAATHKYSRVENSHREHSRVETQASNLWDLISSVRKSRQTEVCPTKINLPSPGGIPVVMDRGCHRSRTLPGFRTRSLLLTELCSPVPTAGRRWRCR